MFSNHFRVIGPIFIQPIRRQTFMITRGWTSQTLVWFGDIVAVNRVCSPFQPYSMLEMGSSNTVTKPTQEILWKRSEIILLPLQFCRTRIVSAEKVETTLVSERALSDAAVRAAGERPTPESGKNIKLPLQILPFSSPAVKQQRSRIWILIRSSVLYAYRATPRFSSLLLSRWQTRPVQALSRR